MKKIWIVILSFAMLFVSGMALTNPIFNVYAEEENSGGSILPGIGKNCLDQHDFLPFRETACRLGNHRRTVSK